MRFVKYGLIGIVCVAIVSFILYEMDIIPEKKDDFVEEHKQKSEETQEVIKEGRKNKNTEGNNEITKEELLERMLDSTLHFDNVQGEYVYIESIGQPRERREETTFIIDRKNLISKQHSLIDLYGMDDFIYSNDEYTLAIDNVQKEYRYVPHIEPKYAGENLNEYTIDQRMYDGLYKDIKGKNLVYNKVISSDLMGSLEFLADWDFNETTFLGFPSYRLEGLDGKWSDSETFTMIVEKDTGIILDYRVYDQDGKDFVSLETKSIEINVDKIDTAVFEPDLDGYTEGDIPDDVPDEYISDEYKEKLKKIRERESKRP